MKSASERPTAMARTRRRPSMRCWGMRGSGMKLTPSAPGLHSAKVSLTDLLAMSRADAQLPAGGVDVLAPGVTHGHVDSEVPEQAREALDPGLRRRLVGAQRRRVEGDQVDVGPQFPGDPRQLHRLVVGEIGRASGRD